MYFLIKRVAGKVAGLLAAAMVALFGSMATLWEAFNVDEIQLTVFLMAVLILLIGAQRDSVGLSLISGLLLGLTVLTKETSFVMLPLTLFTALLLGWTFCGVLVTMRVWWRFACRGGYRSGPQARACTS